MVYAFFSWIETHPAVIAFIESLFAYPVVQGLHVLALGFAVGLLGLADLRLAGLLFERHSERMLICALRPWFVGGFCVLLVTGLLLFLPRARSLAANPLFLTKLGLIAVAGLNAGWFEYNFRRISVGSAAVWRYLSPRVAGWASLLLWITIIVLGRLLAYF